MIDFLHDLRLGSRRLLSSPGLLIVATATFALGVGMSTAMFTVVKAVLLQPLPVREQDRVVVMWGQHAARGFAHMPL